MGIKTILKTTAMALCTCLFVVPSANAELDWDKVAEMLSAELGIAKEDLTDENGISPEVFEVLRAHPNALEIIEMITQQIEQGGTSIPLEQSSPESESFDKNNINGPLTGDVWVARGGEGKSYRFNLSTGVRTLVGEGKVYPSRDGTVYIDVVETDRREAIPGCEDNVVVPYADVLRVSLKSTRSGKTLESYLTIKQIQSPVRLSPDNKRVAVIGNTGSCQNHIIGAPVVLSMKGNVLYQAERKSHSSPIEAFDFTPDNKLVFVRKIRDQTYSLEIESSSGSYDFKTVFGFKFNKEVKRISRIRSNASGNKFLLEAITHELGSYTGFSARESSVWMIDVDARVVKPVFSSNDDDKKLRANEALFSPDGDWVLTTHKYQKGVVILQNNSGSGSDVFTDIAAIPVPPTGVAYAVPVGTVEQPLPPVRVSRSVRPVIGINNGEVTGVGFDPFTDQSWTPSQ